MNEPQLLLPPKKKEGYRWVICMACMLLIICTMGTCTNAFSVYLPYIEANGLDSAAGSMILSVRCFFSLIGMMLVPLFYRRISLRLGMTLTCVMAAAAFFVYAQAETPLQYDAAAAIAGLAYGLGSLIPVAIIINRWFTKNRSFALGLCTAGTGISTICFPPLITLAAERFGLSLTFGGEGVFILICAALIWLTLRDRPKYDSYTVKDGKPKAERNYQMTKPQWLLMIAAILMLGGVSTAAPGHFSLLFTSEGYSVFAASAAISVFGVLLAVGKLVYGRVADRLGGYHPSVLFLTLLAAGCFFCCIARGGSLVPMFLGTVLMGFGFPLATVGLSVLSGDLADDDHVASTLKWFQIIYAGGGMLFSSLPGYLFAAYGSYVLSYQIFSLMTLFIIANVALVYRRRRMALGEMETKSLFHGYHRLTSVK